MRARAPARLEHDCNLAGGRGQHALQLAEDRANTLGHIRHNGSRCDGHKTCHERVLDEVLALRVLPEFVVADPANPLFHAFVLLSLQ